MDKRTKQNIKKNVSDGIGLILTQLKISKPSSKTKSAIKKFSKKLVDILKSEIKRQDTKREVNKSPKAKSVKKLTTKKPA